MPFTTAEILEDIREKTLGIPAGNGGVVTQEICRRVTERPAKFMWKGIEKVIEDLPTKKSMAIDIQEIEKTFGG